MVKTIGIDADSILYKACYRSQLVNKRDGPVYTDEDRKQSFDIEQAYFEFVGTICGIRTAVYSKFGKELGEGETLQVDFDIVFSPKKTFRNDLYPAYKANRKPASIFGIGELKKLIQSRLYTIEVENVEADDVVMTYELIACIDKDIYTHSPVPCFNYNKYEWTEPLSEEEIEDNYYIQALKGDSTDNIKGAKGIGPKKAEQIVLDQLVDIRDTFSEYFDSREEAEMNMRLVRMDQWTREKGLELWKID